jgi:murein DD-endopeptidase MepM/ murein hydrolase activator NlpD
MTIRSAHRPPRPADPSRTRRRRALLAAALLAVAPSAISHSEPALAHVALDLEVPADAGSAGSDAGEQSYTVPATAEPPKVDRTAEVTIVQPSAPAWVLPAAGALRDGFGPRPDAPVAGVGAYHHGQDIGARCGAEVRAAAGGRVVQAGWDGTYGNWILLQHADGVQTGYAHAERLLVHVGQRVKAGAVVAAAGSTGASSGCHLHFEVRAHDTAVDPVAFMRTRGVRLGSR